MCGIFGIIKKEAYISNPNQDKIKEAFCFLGRLNEMRGKDSWGIWTQHQSLKNIAAITPQFKWIREWLEKINLNNTTFLCGHTRHATHGEKTVDNAHPLKLFMGEDVNPVWIAHNGVVTVDGKGRLDHPVDSGQMGQRIIEQAGNTLAEKVIAGMPGVSGSAAFILTHGPEILLYRGGQVLSIYELPWGFMFSSSQAHIQETLSFMGMTGVEFTLKDESLSFIAEDKIMFLDAPMKRWTSGYRASQNEWMNGGRTSTTSTQPHLFNKESDDKIGGLSLNTDADFRKDVAASGVVTVQEVERKENHLQDLDFTCDGCKREVNFTKMSETIEIDPRLSDLGYDFLCERCVRQAEDFIIKSSKLEDNLVQSFRRIGGVKKRES